MFIHLKRWFAPPTLGGDNEKNQLARQLHILLWIILGLSSGALVLFELVLPQMAQRWLMIFGLLDLICVGLLGLLRRGRVQLASALLVLLLSVITTVFAQTAGGIRAPMVYGYLIFVFIAGLLLGIRAGLFTAVICSLSALYLALLEQAGRLPEMGFQHTEFSLWASLSVLMAVAVGLQYLASDTVKRSLQQAQAELAERRQAEAALRDSEARYRFITENTADVIWTLNPMTGRFTYVSPSVQKMRGFSPEEVLTHTLADTITPEMFAPAVARMQDRLRAFRNGDTSLRVMADEMDQTCKDGTVVATEVVTTLVTDASGEIVEIVGVTRDITQRREAEADLSESEEKYRGLVQDSPDAIAIYVDGKIVFANAASVALMGARSAADLLGRAVMELVHPDYRALVAQRMLRARQEGKPLALAEEKFIRFDGTPVDVEVKAIPMTYEHQPAVQLIVRDITERKHLEEAIQLSEAKYRSMVETANEGVLVLDCETRLTLVNQKMAAMLGYTVAEMLGEKLEVFISAEELPDHHQQMQLRVQGQGAVYERCFRRKDGSKLWTIISATVSADAHGRFAGSFSMITDITARKQAEMEIARMAMMLDVAPNAILVHTVEGRFLYANQRAFDLHGYTRAEFMALTLADLTVPASAQLIPPRMQELQAHREAIFQVDHYRKDRTILPLQIYIRLTTWGEMEAVLSIETDITERKQAEQALQESEARFRALVETANDAIITMDTQETIVSWNSAAETVFGFSADQVLGRPVSQIVPEPFRDRQQRAAAQTLAGSDRQIAGKMIETTGLAQDGRAFPIEMSLAEWHTQAGHFFTAIIRDISERKQREKELRAIASLSAALRTAPTRAEMLPVIVEQISLLLNSSTILIEMIDPLTDESVVEAAYGSPIPVIGFRQAPGTGLNAIIRQSRQPYHNNQLKSAAGIALPASLPEEVMAGAGVPLIAQDRLIGFLWMGRKHEISPAEVGLLAAVADIAANALHRATLHEQTQKNAAALMLAYDTTLQGWALALELRDQETEGHTRRVVQMTLDLARAMGIGAAELENVRRGALLHDIGKMGIPDSVLFNPGTLNEREWEIMRQHPDHAYKFLKPIAYLNPALDIPYCHHEKWDGSGYPRGLKGEAIPLVARIFAVVDVWEALCSDRRYRAAWPADKVRRYILEQSGRHFDPRVVQAFMTLLDDQEKPSSGRSDPGFLD